jgi:iron complex transport system substrate-binding protein
MTSLDARPRWRQLRAVRSRRVALADGNQFFNRPGPRLVESLEILAEILHPGEFDYGHRDSGWQLAD